MVGFPYFPYESLSLYLKSIVAMSPIKNEIFYHVIVIFNVCSNILLAWEIVSKLENLCDLYQYSNISNFFSETIPTSFTRV